MCSHTDTSPVKSERRSIIWQAEKERDTHAGGPKSFLIESSGSSPFRVPGCLPDAGNVTASLLPPASIIVLWVIRVQGPKPVFFKLPFWTGVYAGILFFSKFLILLDTAGFIIIVYDRSPQRKDFFIIFVKICNDVKEVTTSRYRGNPLLTSSFTIAGSMFKTTI